MVIRKTPVEIASMRKAGRVLARLLKELAGLIKPGLTTGEIDRFAEAYIRGCGAVPSFKGLYGFPASACVSVNDEVVHGIPGGRRLREGDIVSVDVGAMVDGLHGDCAATFAVGEVPDETVRLLRVTEESLYQGIQQACPGKRVVDISRAIQEHVEANGFSVVRALAGHGIGRSVHEEPRIPNFVVRNDPGPELRPGATLAIEPMVNAGSHDVLTLDDNWTVVTRDGSLSAHFEHTVAVTSDGPEILTAL
ncbi:MAG: type I methionyl aminopeptidase [Firmicutes bacterium]|nr:type I methionyl aminopeptidase [Bacillota bacterium]MDH7496590.1 type I methionyl aminopeptidase [Bacillota bacterium]